jgi:hypothetical protein
MFQPGFSVLSPTYFHCFIFFDIERPFSSIFSSRAMIFTPLRCFHTLTFSASMPPLFSAERALRQRSKRALPKPRAPP